MKKNQLIIFFLLIPVFAVYSQQPDSLNVSKPTIGRVSSVINLQDLVSNGFNYWQDNFSGHWAGVYFGVNGFANTDYSGYPENEKGFLDNELLKSHVLHLNLIQFSAGLQNNRNTFGLVTGLGLGIQSYHLANNTTLKKNASGKVSPDYLLFDSNQKSKFSSVYLNIPLLLEFQIPIKHYANRLYFSAGVIGSKRLSTHTKIKYRKDNKKQKLKSPDSYSIHDYKCSAILQVGYRWINIFATIDLNPLFNDNMGPELYPYTLGIRLIRF